MHGNKDIAAQQEFYDRYWQGLEPLSSYKLQRVGHIMDSLQRIRKQYPREGMRLLDLGCGDGRLLPLWQSITGGEGHGMELSPQAVATAAEMFPYLRYKQGDATNTGYPANHFDIVICQEVIEHVEEQERLADECARIMKPGGALILTTPNKYYFDRRKGGNYSQQPIEKIIDKTTLMSLLSQHFTVQSYETLVYAQGDKGIYRILTNRYLLYILRQLELADAWKKLLLKKGYGLHQFVVCTKH